MEEENKSSFFHNNNNSLRINIAAFEENTKTSLDLFHSIWCHCNEDLDDRNKNICSRFFCRDANRWSRLLGPEFIRQPLNQNNDEDDDDDDEENGPFMYQSPMSGNTVFHSNSLRMEKDIVWDCILSEDDDSTSRVCDLCAGTGLIGLTAASKYSKSIQWLRLCGENEMPSLPSSLQYGSITSIHIFVLRVVMQSPRRQWIRITISVVW